MTRYLICCFCGKDLPLLDTDKAADHITNCPENPYTLQITELRKAVIIQLSYIDAIPDYMADQLPKIDLVWIDEVLQKTAEDSKRVLNNVKMEF